MKTLRLVTIVLTVLGLLFVVALTASAAGVPNTSPQAAAFIDGQTHPIAANTTLWYQFTYAGDRSEILITLANGNGSGLAFNVFTPAQIGDWWETPPIGRGTWQPVSCNTGAPDLNGLCQSNDYLWQGNFNAMGTYYVALVNNTANATDFTLTIQGSGVTVTPAAAPAQPSNIGGAAAPAPVSQPSTATTTTTALMNTDPGHAMAVTPNMINVPANGALWYQFSYPGDRSQILITLPNGNLNGAMFNVYTGMQIGDWWEETPIGRGTGGGNDLIWSGNFNLSGIYYVQVVNPNMSPLAVQLLVVGSGVNAMQ